MTDKVTPETTDTTVTEPVVKTETADVVVDTTKDNVSNPEDKVEDVNTANDANTDLTEVDWEQRFRQQKKYSTSWENKFKKVSDELTQLKEQITASEIKNKVISEKLAGVTVTPDMHLILTGKDEATLTAQAEAILRISGKESKQQQEASTIVVNPLQQQSDNKATLSLGAAILNSLNQ